ncbi:ribbon-helix-helix domain-containing protein [Methanohalophilus halophilus]|uniref:ribbon-helix-helix domain-containing protein n=1 Tax=Methanohalophilus halophilus TaxID=2177 RepID=UPI00373FE434
MSAICQTPEATEMQRITIRLPEQQLEMIDYMVAQGEFPSASEAIRTAVRELIDDRGEKLLRRSEILSAMS